MTALHHAAGIMSRSTRRTLRSPARVRGHGAFTLVEVMVVTVVIAVLATLVLTGLAGARNRAKEDVTRSTIRKLHEIIVPHYETYARRRVTLPPTGRNAPVDGEPRWQRARKYLNESRLLCAREMPDRWLDVGLNIRGDGVPSGDWNVTGPMRAYAAYKASLPTSVANGLQDAECLAMIVLRGGIPVQEAEQFRTNEIGDSDNDGAIEFLDGWRRPIRYVRWQKLYTIAGNDPMDPMRVSGTGTPPNIAPDMPDPALFPVLMSHGPDMLSPTTGAQNLGMPDKGNVDIPDWVEILTGTSRFRNTTQVNLRSPITGDDIGLSVFYGSGELNDDITNVKLWER